MLRCLLPALLFLLFLASPAACLDEKAAAEQFRFAKGLFDRGMLAEAREEAEKFVEYYRGSPFDDKGLFLLAEILFRLQDHVSAARRFGEFIERFPHSELVPDASYSLGWARWRLKDLEGAWPAFARVENSPDREIAADARYRLALIDEARGRLDESERRLEELFRLQPPVGISAEAAFALSRVEIARKKPEEARRTLASFVRRFPDDPAIADAHYNLGELAWMAGKTKTALRHYHDGRQRLPADGDRMRFDRAIAWCLLELEEYSQAEALFRQFPLKGAEADDTRLGLGRCLFQLQKFAEAETVLAAVRGSRRDEAEFYAAYSLYKTRKYRQSAERFARLADGKSSFAVEARFHEGIARFARKEYEAAEQAFRRYLTAPEGKQKNLARFNIAQCRFNREDFAGAAGQLEELLGELAPGDFREQVRFELAETLLAAKETGRAAAVLQDVAAGSPRRAEAWLRLGDIALREGQRTEALRHYQQAAESGGEHGADAALRAARLWIEDGKLADAAPLLARAAGAKGVVAREAAWLQGKIAYEAGQLEEARRLLTPLADSGREFRPEARLHLARIALDTGDVTGAVALLGALNDDPGGDAVRFEARLLSARLAELRGDGNQALRELEAAQGMARAREDQARALLASGELLLRLGRTDPAERTLLKLDILTPKTAAHLPGMFRLAELYRQSGRESAAKKLLQDIRPRLRTEDIPRLDAFLKTGR